MRVLRPFHINRISCIFIKKDIVNDTNKPNVCQCAGGNAAATGSDCTTNGATLCAGCPAGEIKVTGSCVKCTAGKAASGTNAACTSCSTGQYQNQNGARTGYGCKSCGAGTYGNQNGQASSSSCKNCIVGRWSSTVGHGVGSNTVACTATHLGHAGNTCDHQAKAKSSCV